jgi:hypothetical protein
MSKRPTLITFVAEWDFRSTRYIHLTDSPNPRRYVPVYDQRTLRPITVRARSLEEAKHIFRANPDWRVYRLS